MPPRRSPRSRAGRSGGSRRRVQPTAAPRPPPREPWESERPALPARLVPVVATIHALGDGFVVPPLVDRGPQLLGRLSAFLLACVHLAGPVPGFADNQEVPGVAADPLGHGRP